MYHWWAVTVELQDRRRCRGHQPQCCCPRGKSLSSRILEEQFSSPRLRPRPWVSNPWQQHWWAHHPEFSKVDILVPTFCHFTISGSKRPNFYTTLDSALWNSFSRHSHVISMVQVQMRVQVQVQVKCMQVLSEGVFVDICWLALSGA